MNRLSSIGLFFTILLVISSCRTDRSSQIEENILYVRIQEDPGRLNPVLYPISRARVINQNIFLPLADYNPESLEYEPILIKQIPEAEDYGEAGVKYTFEFLDDAQWADGKPITGYDYLFTLKAIMHPMTASKSYRSYAQNVTKAEIDPNNNKRVTVYFEDYYFLSMELVSNMEVLPAHIYDPQKKLENVSLETIRDSEKMEEAMSKDSSLVQFANELNSQKYSRETIKGSGPYKISKWETDEVIVMEKVPNYWANGRKSPFFNQGPDKIVYKIIPDEVSALAQLKSGLVDFVDKVSIDQWTTMKSEDADHNYDFHENNLMKYYFILMNNDHPILKDRSARKALTMCVDVQRYIELFEKGSAQQVYSFVNPAKSYYNKNIKGLPFDPMQAGKDLIEAGWSDSDKDGILDKEVNGKKMPFTIEYYASGKLGSDIGLILKEDAAKAGINIEVIKKKYSQIKKENLNTGNIGMLISVLAQSLAMDDPFLRFHSKNATLGGSNYAQYRNEKVDQLIEEIKRSRNSSGLIEKLNEIQELIYDDQPFVFLYVPKFRAISDSEWNVKTTVKRPGIFPNTWNLAKKPVEN